MKICRNVDVTSIYNVKNQIFFSSNLLFTQSICSRGPKGHTQNIFLFVHEMQKNGKEQGGLPERILGQHMKPYNN
jgi:hypothetical protein